MSRDYSLQYLDQKKWIKRSPEEIDRLAHLRKKQGGGESGEEVYEKWERALQYSGSAMAEARKRYREAYHDRQDLAQHLVVSMFEKDAKKSTMIKESRKFTSEVSAERDRLVYYGLQEDLEELLELGDQKDDVPEAPHAYWTTWHLKACLLTGKLLPKDKVHKTASLDYILLLGDEDLPILDDRVIRSIRSVKNEKYQQALIAITEGSLADHAQRAAAVSQSRALEVLAKILNGVWSGACHT